MAGNPVATQDPTPRVTLEAWLVTDIGMVREHNEDSAHSEPDRGFFIVADGMGGHAAGEVASAMAVQTVKETLAASRPEIDEFAHNPTDVGRRAIVQLLQNAVLSAHRAVFSRGQAEPDKAGMGTTLDVVLVAGPEAFVAHVGDSRTYLIRDGRSSQVTTDHTVAEVLVIEGKLTIEEAQVSPLRTILVNAIGVSEDVGVEMAHVALKKHDRILVCSDGLHDYFPAEDEIAEKLSSEAPGEALAEMVELAKTRGGHDNITGITILITEVVEAPTDERASEASEASESVDVPAPNPFADEPTETTFIQPPGLPPRMIGQVAPPLSRATQPMRVVSDEEVADTIPPSLKKPLLDEPNVDTDPQRTLVAPIKAKAKKAKGAKARDPEGPTEPADPPEPSDTEDNTEPSRGASGGPEAELGAADTGRIHTPDGT